jgi:hypothetical protein
VVHSFVTQSYDVIVTERYDDDRYTAAKIYRRDTSLHVRYGRFVTHRYRVTTSGYDPLPMVNKTVIDVTDSVVDKYIFFTSIASGYHSCSSGFEPTRWLGIFFRLISRAVQSFG